MVERNAYRRHDTPVLLPYVNSLLQVLQSVTEGGEQELEQEWEEEVKEEEETEERLRKGRKKDAFLRYRYSIFLEEDQA
eukprot:evm.model.NODE_7006_length_6284_cov_39.080044.1